MPDMLAASLKPFQIPLADKAERSLRKDRLHVLATCTGSGKSYISADVLRRLDRPVLAICPKAAVTQTRRCFEAMGADGLLLDIVNPQQLIVSKKCEWYDPKAKWRIPKGTVVLWDEIHRGCSGMDSQATLACAELRAYGASLLALSATVACDPVHLRALGYWAGMHRFNEPDFKRWCLANGCATVLFNNRYELLFTKDRARAEEVMRSLRLAFGDMFQSLGPEDIEGFPEEICEVLLIDLNSRDREEVQAAYAAMSERMKTPGKNDMAEMVRERERIEFTMAAAIAERVSHDVDDGVSPVVFWNFTSARERFENMMLERGLQKEKLVAIHGDQKDAERQDCIDRFNRNDAVVASVNAAAGGCALSLHDVLHERQRVSYLIPSFNAAEVKQAFGRIRRVGGTRVVQRFALAAGTLMEKVAVSLNRKLSCIDSLNDNDLTV